MSLPVSLLLRFTQFVALWHQDKNEIAVILAPLLDLNLRLSIHLPNISIQPMGYHKITDHIFFPINIKKHVDCVILLFTMYSDRCHRGSIKCFPFSSFEWLVEACWPKGSRQTHRLCQFQPVLYKTAEFYGLDWEVFTVLLANIWLTDRLYNSSWIQRKFFL